ncbi:MAG: 50S ribosomal protein L17 [Acidobacteria bacterium RBG_16_64_8]|nr:MAG: 50S ribosomal protein L17 [Acidobacteria bacterium RBG_16_64_8]
MRHNVSGRKLGRTTAHRLAMFRNQLADLVREERIITTLPKAKELRPIAERVVTHGKRGSVQARRLAGRLLTPRALIKKLFDEIGPRFRERAGGYLRIVKLGPRSGDGAEMAVLEFVDYQMKSTPAPEKGKKGAKGGEAATPAEVEKGAAGRKKSAKESEPEAQAAALEKKKPKAAAKKATAKPAKKKAEKSPAKKKPAKAKGAKKGS